MDLPPLGSVPPADLVSARHALHNAVQIIASFGHHLADPQPDDSHRSMSWLPDQLAFQGVPLSTGFSVRLDPVAYRVELVGSLEISLDLEGRPLTESLKDLQRLAGVKEFGFAVFDETLPDQAFIQSPLVLPDLPHRKELALHYGHAFQALASLPLNSPIRVWPHHFDIATILYLGREDAQVGLGLSPGDNSCAEPYWYMTPWPTEPNAMELELPNPWKWVAKDWTGMVLKTSDLVHRSNPDQFLLQTLQLCLTLAKKSIAYQA